MAKNCKYLVFVVVLLFTFNFSGLAQDLSLTPPQTELVNQSKEQGQELVINSGQYKSRHSKEGIVKFYRLMFANQGFTEVKGQPPKKDKHKLNYFFTKQSEGTMVLLNFLRLVDEGLITYFITTHQFSLKERANLESSPEN